MFNTLRFDDVQQTLDQFRQTVDQLFGKLYSSSNRSAEDRDWTFSPAIETGWDNDALHLRAIVPGVNEKDITVTVENGQLVIEGERKAPENAREGFRQMAYGKFYSAITLPGGVDLEKVACELHDGVLDVTVPVAEHVKPRQIPIQSGAQQKSIAA